MKTYTYTDSEAGKQKDKFDSLSEIVKHIEEFGYHGDSDGVVLQDSEPIIEYSSREHGLTWQKA